MSHWIVRSTARHVKLSPSPSPIKTAAAASIDFALFVQIDVTKQGLTPYFTILPNLITPETLCRFFHLHSILQIYTQFQREIEGTTEPITATFVSVVIIMINNKKKRNIHTKKENKERGEIVQNFVTMQHRRRSS